MKNVIANKTKKIMLPRNCKAFLMLKLVFNVNYMCTFRANTSWEQHYMADRHGASCIVYWIFFFAGVVPVRDKNTKHKETALVSFL